MTTTTDITRLIGAVRADHPGALDRLFEAVYDELRHQAHRQLRHTPRSATLSTTALVNEAYLKLLAARQPDWEDRRHFYHVAARAMRQIIIDGARRALADKRGGGALHVDFEQATLPVADRAEELLALEQAMSKLARRNQRLASVVELHFYGGLRFDEIAAALAVSDRTVKRDWRLARAFLYQYLEPTPPAE